MFARNDPKNEDKPCWNPNKNYPGMFLAKPSLPRATNL